MSLLKLLIALLIAALLIAALLVLGTAGYSSGQNQRKKEQSKEEKELIGRCRYELNKNGFPLEPTNWELKKGEKYQGGPVISYTIEEDGTVTNVKLKHRSGFRKIDEYYVTLVKGRKLQPIPGCRGPVRATLNVIVHFQ